MRRPAGYRARRVNRSSAVTKPKPPANLHPATPDGRYLVVRGRLWRLADPSLPAARRQALVDELMAARRALRGGGASAEARAAARARVDAAKQALGERGPPWWNDGAPDFNRRLVKNTPYAGWYAGLTGGASAGGRPGAAR